MKRLALLLSALALTALSVAPAALAADSVGDVLTGNGAVTATLAEVGSRSIAAVGAITFAGTSGLSTPLTAAYNVVITEVARTGTNPWSVTGKICGADAALPAVPDCTNRPNALYNSGGTSNIASSNISASSQAFATLTNGATVLGQTIAGSGGGTPAAGSFSDLGATRTLGTNSGQNNNLLYSGGYQAQGNLSLTAPNGTAVGAYSGYFVVTLIN